MAFVRTATVMGALLLLGTAGDAAAQKLSKEEKQWLDETRPIMLADEEKTYRELKDKRDRDEFVKIFWARRDPTPATPQNEFRDEIARLRAEADAQFRVAGRPGSQTDCGRVYMLLGKPAEMKSQTAGENPMLRTAETWTYRDSATQKFPPSGEAQIQFEGNCELGQGNRYAEALNRIAMDKITSPNLGFKKGDDGKLVSLVDQLPKPSPAQTLLSTPRQDFTVTAEPSLYLPAPDGSVFVAGLVRADASAFPAQADKTKVVVATRAVDASGKTYAGNERQVTADVAADKTAVASFGMSLRPGDYTLHVASVEPASGKGSAVAVPLKVPDFNAGGVVVSPLTIVSEVQDTTTKTAEDPLADFVTGAGRLVPRYGNEFTLAESVTVIAQVFVPKVEGEAPAPGATAVGSTFTILKDGAVVARASEQSGSIVSVGPIPLAKYGPGKFTVQLKVTDKVAKKDYLSEATYQVK